MKRARSTFAAAAAALAGFLLPLAGAGQAQAADGPYAMVNLRSGMCLDAGSAQLRSHVQLWSCNGTADQQWTRVWTNGYVYQLQNRQSGLCLSTDPTGYSGNGAWAILEYCWGTEYETWAGRNTPGDFSPIVQVATSRALDADASGTYHNGTKVQIWDENDYSQQYWRPSNP